MSNATGTREPGAAGGPDGFEETVKDFWASRPRRPRSGRKCAGVAAGVGYRYGIDPVVVRVALVVTTILGGIGLCVYVLGWLFFPDERDEVSAFESLLGKGHSSTSKACTVFLCIALFPLLSWTFGGSWFDSGGFIGLGLLAAALYLLHRSRGQYNRPTTPRSVPAGFASAAFTSADVVADGSDSSAAGQAAASASADTASEERGRATADSAARPAAPSATWDPLGAAPLAWDLPDPPAAAAAAPSRPAVRTRRRGRTSKVGVATLGVALVVAGVGAALIGTDSPWFSAAHVVGIVLGVLGIGLVTASFAGGGRGLIALALPLSLLGIVLTAVPFSGVPHGVGSITRAPTSVATLPPAYERGVGSIDLDLTRLPQSASVELPVHVGVGSAMITVPSEADVTFTCSTGMGEVDCLDAVRGGIGTQEVTGTKLGPDGPGGQDITLDVTAGMGSVEVRRG